MYAFYAPTLPPTPPPVLEFPTLPPTPPPVPEFLSTHALNNYGEIRLRTDVESFRSLVLEQLEKGERLHDEGDYPGAIKAYKWAQGLRVTSSFVLENRIGLSFSAMGDHQKAIEHFTKSLEIRDTPVDRVNRAGSYIDNGECALAVHDAQKALGMDAEWDPGFHTKAAAYLVLASCHAISGDY